MIDYDSLDPNIKQLVRLINGLGYITTDSGDGTSKEQADETLPFPHVFVAGPERLTAIAPFADELYAELLPLLKAEARQRLRVEATYSAADCGIIVGAFDVSDRDII